jgi:threonine dehydrogenase-like Zn-dependent dehydrogenase
MVRAGRFDPTPLITHSISLDDIADGYRRAGGRTAPRGGAGQAPRT